MFAFDSSQVSVGSVDAGGSLLFRFGPKKLQNEIGSRVPHMPILRVGFSEFSARVLMVLLSYASASGVSEQEFGYARAMGGELEGALVAVWRQSLIDEKKSVEVEGESYAVRRRRRGN